MKYFIITMLYIVVLAMPTDGLAQTGPSDEDIRYTAATLYGEGYMEGHQGMLAILEVIENRSRRSGKSLKQVVLQPWQFSAWNDDSPMAETLRKLSMGRSSGNESIDAAFQEVLGMTRAAILDQNRVRLLENSTFHYWAHNTMETAPYWYNGEPTIVMGGHTFADGIR